MNRVSKKLYHRGQVDITEMSVEQTSIYKYFLVYEDLLSKFVILNALSNNTANEVANKLCSILTIIGAPQVLQSNNGRDFAEQVVRELRILWKDSIILHGNMCEYENNNRDFKNLIRLWLTKNPGKNWHEGLKFIQIYLNSLRHSQNGQIVENTEKLIVQIPNTIWAEEEWGDDILNKEENCNDQANGSNVSVENDTISTKSNETDKENDNNYSEQEDSSCNNYQDEYTKSKESLNSFKFVSVKSDTSLDNIHIEDSEEANFYFNGQNLKCQVCQKQYMKLGHLKNHMKIHKKKKQINCAICNKTFHLLSLYEKHMQQFHKCTEQMYDRERKNVKSSKDEEINFNHKNEIEVKKDISRNEITAESNVRFKNNDTSPNMPSKRIKSTKTSSLMNRKQFSLKKRENRVSKLNGNPRLECSYCKQKFNFPSVLKRHMRSHTNERPYICKICNKSFKQLGHLSQHSLTHKDYRSFQCLVCGIKSESLDTLKQHSQSHQGESNTKSKNLYRLFECDNCKKVFTAKSVLERHIFTHTHERQFGCKICGKRFKQAGHVKSHMLVHTGERKFECTVCTKRFSLSNSLKKHMYIHNGEKPYQCDVCGARFLEKRNLNGHLMTHTNERPFSCKICGKRYTLADTLRRHISAAHEDGRTYQCEICAKMFKQLAHLSVHKKVHNDERPFQCHLCEKNFKHKNVLKSHLAIHANIRPFECDICKATFVRKTNLQTHIASAHMNERPYTCNICGKRFKQISHLNGHVVVHSNSMPYQCDFCDRRCNRLDNLKKHMRLHTKNKEQSAE